MKSSISLLLPAIFSALLLTGCGRKSSPAAPPPVADTPDQAILQVARGMENNDPSIAWHALPDSYQNDLTQIVRQFAGAVDAEVWQAGTSTVTKLEEVLRRQKRFFMGSDFAMMMGGADAIEKDYDQLVAILSILKQSDLMDLQKLRNADPGRILATTGAELMAAADAMQGQGPGLPGMGNPNELKEAFAGMEAQMLSRDGDSAVVQITTLPGGSEDVEFVRVEGKWVPKDLAEDWPDMIQEMQDGIARTGTLDPQQKSQVLMMSGMANGIFDQLLGARTQQDFNAVLGGLMGMMMGGM